MQLKITQAVAKDALPSLRDINITDDTLAGFELRVRPSGSKTWVFRYRINGGPQRRHTLGSFPGVSAEAARKLALIATGDVAKGIDVVSQKREAKAAEARLRVGTLETFIDQQYEPWAKIHLQSWEFQLKRIRSDFKDWLSKPMVSLDTILLEKWRAGRLEAGTQPITVNRNAQRLHALLSRAVEWKVLERHPFAGLKPLKHDKSGRVRYLEEEEEHSLREALIAREERFRQERLRFNAWRIARHKLPLPVHDKEFVDHLRPMSLLALNTGLRRGELFKLRLKDVNLRTRWITVAGPTAKNKQTRRVPLNAEATWVLDTWIKKCRRVLESPLVFPGEKDKPLKTITTAWRRVQKAAKLRDFHFHDLRHHFASRLVQSGVDLNTVRELLGHADIAMVLRYAHLAPGGLASAVEKVARTSVVESQVAA